METQIINISPSKIDNTCKEFEITSKLFTQAPDSIISTINDKVEYLIEKDGSIFGYTLRQTYARDVVKTGFEQKIYELYSANNSLKFRVKLEKSANLETYKLYQVIPGSIWGESAYKISTVSIRPINRVCIKQSIPVD